MINVQNMTPEQFHAMKKRVQKDYVLKLEKEEKDVLLFQQIDALKREVELYNNILKEQTELIVDLDINERNIEIDTIIARHKWNNKKLKYNIVDKKQQSIFQFSIFTCELGENIGNEKSKTRPVIILSKNPFVSSIVIVAPITTTKVKNSIQINKHVKYGNVSGYIDLKHLRSVDKNRLSFRAIDRLLFDNEYSEDIGPIKPHIIKKFKELIV
ncbi:MAG: type II toxin-antitoxin system PemK/MazF family toxin [Clostridia bacterium]|jgi:mRNA-degrading endonuclease toxin of MazEF toxin-antitoxin module|nr:type II toxin-antitoxin system PemK/MazF family toxin [Clostridia bacterium]